MPADSTPSATNSTLPSEPSGPARQPSSQPGPGLFSGRPDQPSTPVSVLPWALAGLSVLAFLAALVAFGRHKPAPSANAPLQPDTYASSLALSGMQMSESTSLSGGKSTFIDGRIRNLGARTVTAATAQVLFSNDQALPPQVETLPLTLVRTREPYVDTQSIAAAPIGPGDEREFRLIFENIGPNWNQNLPEIRLIRVATR